MYEITCDTCGRVAIHLSRTGAEALAERHQDETEHGPEIAVVEDA